MRKRNGVIRSERGFTTSVNDIEHIESRSLQGVGVVKMFFHPTAKVEAAVAQLSASSNSMVHFLPPGISSPFILRYSASTVPILQLSVSSDTLSEQVLFDTSVNVIRTQMATVQGSSVPMPYGGKPRQIMVDLNPDALQAKGLSPQDVMVALNSQSLTQPAGSAKIGSREYTIRLNNSPETVNLFNNIPLKASPNGALTYMRDVANVHDGFAVQTNIVRNNGKRGLVLSILKNGSASTLDIVQRMKEALPRIKAVIPPEVNLSWMFDQSVFVRNAIESVIKEAGTAALLTALMILLFLGSWRSTIIVCVSIPCSIMASLAILYLMGETLNIMTLGGLALAVGILVDDATVEIENIHRNLGQNKPLVQAILDGAQQIAVPTFVSTLCICIVFVPVIFLSGAARYLFTPLALAVALAMGASYLLSRTLVPTMVRYLLAKEVELYRTHGEDGKDHGWIWNIHMAFNRWFELRREAYKRLLSAALDNRKTILAFFLFLSVASASLLPFIGTDFFPAVDAGQIRLHVRTAPGTRIEETERIFANVENSIRRIIPQEDLADILDNIGLPNAGMNLGYSDSVTVGSFDGEILVSLKPDHAPTENYIKALRKQLAEEYPQELFFFQPADIVAQILNFGIPAPIDIQIAGPVRNYDANFKLAREMQRKIETVPGTADVHIMQVDDVPELKVNVDRTRARQLGLSQQDVQRSMVVSLASSAYVGTNWWLNTANGVDYLVAVQTPPHKIQSTNDILKTPLRTPSGRAEQLESIADVERVSGQAVVSHYNAQPMINIYANVQDSDLGSVSREVYKVIDSFQKKLPRGSFINLRGQVETMEKSFVGMGYGIGFAILLVYFIMVVNFQSWLDPFIILMALPGALSGILLMLFITQTTISVPSLMGAIMSIGVATANSILLVNFANEVRGLGLSARDAAIEAGSTRLRPVIMTACAMITGMLPMAFGWGEGGEQNAPLGRAVIGGLLVATFATLFFVPVVYSYLRKKAPKDYDREELA